MEGEEDWGFLELRRAEDQRVFIGEMPNPLLVVSVQKIWMDASNGRSVLLAFDTNGEVLIDGRSEIDLALNIGNRVYVGNRTRPKLVVSVRDIWFRNVNGVLRDARVLLGFKAPKRLRIVREELLDRESDRGSD